MDIISIISDNMFLSFLCVIKGIFFQIVACSFLLILLVVFLLWTPPVCILFFLFLLVFLVYIWPPLGNFFSMSLLVVFIFCPQFLVCSFIWSKCRSLYFSCFLIRVVAVIIISGHDFYDLLKLICPYFSNVFPLNLLFLRLHFSHKEYV